VSVNCLELYLHITYTSVEMVTYLGIWLSTESFSYIDLNLRDYKNELFTLFLNQGRSPWNGAFWGVDISGMKMFFCGLPVWNASDISFVKLVKTDFFKRIYENRQFGKS